MVTTILILLLVLAPFFTGLLCWSIKSRAWLERLNLLAYAIVAGLAAWLVARTLDQGVIEACGGYLRVDALSAMVVGLSAFVSVVSGIYAVGYLREEERAGRINSRLTQRYYILSPIFVAILLAIPLVDNLGLLWVIMESATLASVLLVRFFHQKSSLEAAWKYMVIGGAGIALALFGTVMAYYSAASVLEKNAENGFNWSVLVQVAGQCSPEAMRLAFVMILVGYGTKAGLVPMHTWKPDAYSEAPVPVAALFGAGFINCALYCIIRFHILASKCLGFNYTSTLLVIFGILSMLVAAPFVLTQRNLRRLLAYSSIDHAGIMVAAIGFGGKWGALGAILHMLFHAVTKPLMFFCAGNVQQHYGTPYFRKIAGVIRTLPYTGVIFLMAAFAVTGAPPFGLFQSELTILSAAISTGWFWAAGLFVTAIVTIFAGFLVRMSELCLGNPLPGSAPGRECPWKTGAILLTAVPAIWLALLLPAPIYDLAQRAALIIGGAP